MARFIVLMLLSSLLLAACGGEDAGETHAGEGDPGQLQVLDWPLPGAEPGTSAPDLAVAADGRVLLSWLDSQPGRRHLFRFSAWNPALERWQHAPANIAIGSRMFVNWADTPHIMASLDGAIWAHWLQKSGTANDYGIALVRSRDGANWSAPLVPHAGGTGTEHGFASMWPHGTDLLGIAWLDGRSTGGDHDAHDGHETGADEAGTDQTRAHGSSTLRAALVDPALRVVQEAVIDTRVCECCQTTVALTSRGPLLFYRGRSPDEVRDVLVSRLEGNVWTAPRRIHADGWVMSACPVNGPSAQGHGHNVVAAWYTEAGGEPQVRLVHSADAGDSFGEPLVLDSGAEVHGRVAVALDGHQAGALWLREDGDGQSLWYARFAPDLSHEIERIRLAGLAGRGRGTGFPRLVFHQGVAHAVWTDVIDGRPQLRGARMVAGPAEG